MAVPKHRGTKGRRNQRRMHLFMKEPTMSVCSHCGKEVLPHIVCAHCGFYKGIEKINVLAKLEKKEKKVREKEIKETEKEQKSSKKEMSLEELSRQKF